MRVLAIGLLGLILGCGKSKEPAPASGSGAAGGSGSSVSAVESAPSVTLPEVAGHGYEVNPSAARVVATPTAVVVDGKQVLALENGVVPAAAVTDGHIAAIVAGLSAPSRDARMMIALDKQLSFGLFYQLVSTLKTQGLRSFGLLAHASGQPVMLPIDLRDTARTPAPAPRRTDPAAGLAAAILEEQTTVEVTGVSVSPESSLSGDGVKIKVSGAYIPMLKRCAAKAAGRNSTPKDSFELTFTIDETGRATEPSVAGTMTDVAECITGSMTSWRFPIPKDSNREGMRMTAKVTLGVRYPERAASEPTPAVDASASGPRSSKPSPNPDEQPLGMAVAITKTDVVVFSISGLEGTLAQPILRIGVGNPTVVAKVSNLLDNIVKKRWGGKAKRAEHDLDIILIAEPETPMQMIAELLGAVRASPTGSELFPHVRLSVGFE